MQNLLFPKFLIIFFFFCYVPVMGGETTRTPQKPNIIVILADDVGYGDVGCYGAQSVKTPNIDRLAREGIRFTDAHAASATCTPSRYALLTGKYPWRTKGTAILPGNAALIIPPGSVTLPSIMKKAGYKTGVVGKWHLGLGNRRNPNEPENALDWNGELKPGPLEVGFDYSFIFPATADRVPCVYIENHRIVNLDPNDPIQVDYRKKIGNEPTGKENPDLLKMGLDHGHDCTIINGISRIGWMSGGKSAWWNDETIADTFTEKACRFIENNRATPFFLYFATSDIHVPRVANPRFVGKTQMGARGDVIVQLDWSVGEILKTLDKLGISDNTIVIFTSDNGPVLNDGYLDEAVDRVGSHRPGGPLRGGKYSIFEAGTRVPFLLRWPTTVSPGTSDALFCLMDLPASVQALTGQNVLSKNEWDSENMLDVLKGKDPVGRKELVLHGACFGIRQNHWKAILPSQGPARQVNTKIETGRLNYPQLYDLSRDIGEQQNLFNPESTPEEIKKQWTQMQNSLMKTRQP